MKSSHRLSVIVAALVFSVSLARGEQGPDPSPRAGEIASWPTPPYWNPPARPVSAPERERGVRTEGVEALATSPLPFIGITPCRIADTRGNGFTGAYGPPALVGNGPARNFDIPAGPCPGIPATAGAYSVNVAAIGPGADGFMTVFPGGTEQPTTSDLSFLGGEVTSNAIVAPAGKDGSIDIFVNVTTHFILDINGYYAPAGVGSNNTFLGLNAGNFTMTGDFNTGIGVGALQFTTTGGFNTGVGLAALQVITTGEANTANGTFALFNNAEGSFNTAIGFAALPNNAGSANIALGARAGIDLTTGDNNICIGNPGVAGESNAVRIGTAGTHLATFIAGINGAGVTGVPVLVSSSGQLGIASSSRHAKEAIREIGVESDGLMRLRPVAFKYTPQIDPSGLAQYGLIAEEVADVYPDLVAYDRDGRPETVRYHLVNALLLNEVQKQHRIAEAQKMTIEREKAEIEELKARLSRLEARVPAE